MFRIKLYLLITLFCFVSCHFKYDYYEMHEMKNMNYLVKHANFPTQPTGKWYDLPKLAGDTNFYFTHAYITHKPLVINEQLNFGLENINKATAVNDYLVKQIENSFLKLNGLTLQVQEPIIHDKEFNHYKNKDNAEFQNRAILYPYINQEIKYVKKNKYRDAYYENYIDVKFTITKGFYKQQQLYSKKHILVIQLSEEAYAKQPEKLNITQDQWDFIVADLMKEYLEALDKKVYE